MSQKNSTSSDKRKKNTKQTRRSGRGQKQARKTKSRKAVMSASSSRERDNTSVVPFDSSSSSSRSYAVSLTTDERAHMTEMQLHTEREREVWGGKSVQIHPLTSLAAQRATNIRNYTLELNRLCSDLVRTSIPAECIFCNSSEAIPVYSIIATIDSGVSYPTFTVAWAVWHSLHHEKREMLKNDVGKLQECLRVLRRHHEAKAMEVQRERDASLGVPLYAPQHNELLIPQSYYQVQTVPPYKPLGYF